nr:hypothetical protein [Lentisphaera araneosa]
MPLKTVLQKDKITQQNSFVENHFNCEVSGYEIHHGLSTHTKDKLNYFCESSKDGIIYKNTIGTYLHGVLDSPQFRQALFKKFKSGYQVPKREQDPIDRIADHFEKHLDMNQFR